MIKHISPEVKDREQILNHLLKENESGNLSDLIIMYSTHEDETAEPTMYASVETLNEYEAIGWTEALKDKIKEG